MPVTKVTKTNAASGSGVERKVKDEASVKPEEETSQVE
jgi:hypothetical protein